LVSSTEVAGSVPDQEAHDLDRDTLQRRREVLGSDHQTP